MKNIILIIIALFLNIKSFSQPVEKGTIHMNAGIGFPNNLGRLFKAISSLNGDVKVKSSPVLQFSLDATVSDEFQIGILYGHTSVKMKEKHDGGNGFTYTSEQKITSTIIGLKLEYVTELNSKSTLYGGPTILYSLIQFKPDIGYLNKIDGIGIYPHLGITRKFSKSTSGYLELGYGMALINTGVKVRLK